MKHVDDCKFSLPVKKIEEKMFKRNESQINTMEIYLKARFFSVKVTTSLKIFLEITDRWNKTRSKLPNCVELRKGLITATFEP